MKSFSGARRNRYYLSETGSMLVLVGFFSCCKAIGQINQDDALKVCCALFNSFNRCLSSKVSKTTKGWLSVELFK